MGYRSMGQVPSDFIRLQRPARVPFTGPRVRPLGQVETPGAMPPPPMAALVRREGMVAVPATHVREALKQQLMAVAVGIGIGMTIGAALRGSFQGRVAANPRRRRRTSKRSGSRRRTSKRTYRRRMRRNTLTKAERARLPASAFVFPDKRSWPIQSQKQAKAAISYLHMGRVSGASQYNAIRSAIIGRYGTGFWRDAGAPSWQKVKKARDKRTRGRRRYARAAN